MSIDLIVALGPENIVAALIAAAFCGAIALLFLAAR